MRICRQRGVLLIAGTTFSVNLACIEGISAIVYTRRTPDTLLAVIDCVPLHSSRESAIERTLAPPGQRQARADVNVIVPEQRVHVLDGAADGRPLRDAEAGKDVARQAGEDLRRVSVGVCGIVRQGPYSPDSRGDCGLKSCFGKSTCCG